MHGCALPVLQARLLTLPLVFELIREHISEIGVITLLCSRTKFRVCVCFEWAYVCKGRQVNENATQQISEQILCSPFLYSFENPRAPLSPAFMLDAA